MKDSADGEPDADGQSTEHTSAGTDVPPHAEWEFAVQKPVDCDSPGDLTTTIVYAVAEAEGASPVDIQDPPLFDVVDTAALEEAFFCSDDTQSEGGETTAEFMYRDHRIVVRSDGWVLVHDRVDEA